MGAFERITVEVSTEMADAMRRSVADGAYDSADQIVADALHDWSLARRPGEAEIVRLRRLIGEGDNSGPSIPADQVYAEIEAIISSYDRDR